MRFDFCSSKSEFTFMNFLIKHFHPVKAFLYLYDHFGFLYETVGFYCSTHAQHIQFMRMTRMMNLQGL